MNERTLYGFSIDAIKQAIKDEVNESCTEPWQFWEAYKEAFAELVEEDASDWLIDYDK